MTTCVLEFHRRRKPFFLLFQERTDSANIAYVKYIFTTICRSVIESFFTRGRWCEPRLRGRSGRFGARGKRLKADLGFDSEVENYEDIVKNLPQMQKNHLGTRWLARQTGQRKNPRAPLLLFLPPPFQCTSFSLLVSSLLHHLPLWSCSPSLPPPGWNCSSSSPSWKLFSFLSL